MPFYLLNHPTNPKMKPKNEKAQKGKKIHVTSNLMVLREVSLNWSHSCDVELFKHQIKSLQFFDDSLHFALPMIFPNDNLLATHNRDGKSKSPFRVSSFLAGLALMFGLPQPKQQPIAWLPSYIYSSKKITKIQELFQEPEVNSQYNKFIIKDKCKKNIIVRFFLKKKIRKYPHILTMICFQKN